MNIFKQNDDYINKPKYNQFKSYNSAPIVTKKDFEIKMDEFPDLASPVNNNNNSKSFSSLLKKEEVKNVEDKKEIVEYIIPAGWSCYKYTKINGFGGGIYSKNITNIEKPVLQKNNEILEKKVALNEEEEIINALQIIHEKRTKKYKELWGEDEWEKMFIFPNHDYEYFDKLDEAYELEQEKLYEKYYKDYNDYTEYNEFVDSDNY